MDRKVTSPNERDRLYDLIDRAVKMLWLACPETRVVHADDNNPLVAWVADATKALQERPHTLSRDCWCQPKAEKP